VGTGAIVALILGSLAACGPGNQAGNEARSADAGEDQSAGSTAVITQAQLVEAMEAGDSPILLDVRRQDEFEEGHIEGAIHIPFDELPARAAEIGAPMDAPIVVYCRTGRRAGIAEAALAEAGYTNLKDLEGHIQSWNSAGLPLVGIEAD